MSSRTDVALRDSAFTSPLVGRGEELRIAQAILKRAIWGHGQVIGLVGKAGVGKSRLAAEIQRIARRLDFEPISGTCGEQGATLAYQVWHPIGSALFEVDPSRPASDQEARLAARLAERDGGSSQRAPLLGPVTNLPMADSELTASLEPETRAQLLQSLVLDQVRATAAVRPLLLILEDCHWIDPASSSLLEFLARNLGEVAVLVVATSRPVDGGGALAALGRVSHYTEIQIADLPTEDAERLVTHRIRALQGEVVVGHDLVGQLVAQAGGNPFHLEELVRFLLQPDADPKAPARWWAATSRPTCPAWCWLGPTSSPRPRRLSSRWRA